MSNTSFNKDDVGANRVYGILSYISILFIVGLIVAKDSEFVKFHANQGIVLFLASFAASFIGFIPFIGGIISGLLGIMIFGLSIAGVIYAAMGEKRPLPIVGQIIIIK